MLSHPVAIPVAKGEAMSGKYELEQLKAMTDDDLESLSIAIARGWAEQDKAGQVIAEIKRRERSFQREQIDKQLNIAKWTARAAIAAAVVSGLALAWQLLASILR